MIASPLPQIADNLNNLFHGNSSFRVGLLLTVSKIQYTGFSNECMVVNNLVEVDYITVV